MNKKTVSRPVILAFAVLLFAAGAALLIFSEKNSTSGSPWPTDGRPVKTAAVVRSPETASREFPGIARAARQARLAFRVGGPLLDLPVEVGQFVAKGSLIARIDPRDFRVQVDRLTARLAAYEAQLTDARLQYERYKNLLATKSAPQAEYDHARAVYEDLTARAAETRQGLEDARNALGDTRMSAPFNGYVHQKHVETHDNVQAKQPIITFLDCSVIEVTAGIPEEMVSEHISFTGFACTFDAYPGMRTGAQLLELGRKPSPSNQSYPLTVRLSPPDSISIRPGMAATVCVSFTNNETPAPLSIPVEAVVDDAGGAPFVWIVNAGKSTVEKRSVTPGRLLENGIEITQGLAEGEVVVSAGAHYLHQGQKVAAEQTRWKRYQQRSAAEVPE